MRRPRSHRFPGFARTQIPGLQVKQMGLSYCCCACLALCMDPSWDHPCRMARISRSSAMQGFRQGLQHQRTSGEEVRRIHSVSTGLDPSDSVNAPRIFRIVSGRAACRLTCIAPLWRTILSKAQPVYDMKHVFILCFLFVVAN